MKILWLDPAYRAKQSASRKAAWLKRDRAKQAKVMREIWSSATLKARKLHCERISSAKKTAGARREKILLREKAANLVRKHLGFELGTECR